MPEDLTVVLDVELVAESAEPVLGVPHRIPHGWAALSVTGELLLMHDQLTAIGRLAVPAEILQDRPVSVGLPPFRVDVSPDLRFAAFAGTSGIVIVDRDGDVQWRASHPVPSVGGTNEVASCAVFTPDASSVWAFVPRLAKADAGPDDLQSSLPPVSIERHVLDVGTWRTTVRAATDYRCHSRILLHPDGKHAGYGTFDGHDGWSCRWVRWDDDCETVVAKHWMKPIDIHPSGDRWLAHTPCELVLGDFRSETVSIIPVEADTEDAADEDWEEHPYHGYDLEISAACLISPDLVLARCDDLMEDGRPQHRLFRVDPPQVLGPVSYPQADFQEDAHRGDDAGIASAGDGTWLTFTRNDRLKLWRMR